MKSVVEKHFDVVAANYDKGKQKYGLYYSTLKQLLGLIIPKNSDVCEIGCGTGDLLASVSPKNGFGMDISSQMINVAKRKYSKNKKLKFSTKYPGSKYKYIFMCDVIEHLEKPEQTFRAINKLMNKDSMFINTMANPMWEPLLMVWEKMGLKMKEGRHYRMKFREIETLLKKSGLKVQKHDYKLLIPVDIPVITHFFNKFLEKPLRKLSFIEYFVAVKA